MVTTAEALRSLGEHGVALKAVMQEALRLCDAHPSNKGQGEVPTKMARVGNPSK